MFRVHFAKLSKNNFKSTVSFKLVTNLPKKNKLTSNVQDITAMKYTTNHKKIREIESALGKN